VNALTESSNGFLTDFLIRMFGEVDINSKYSVLCGTLLKREENISVNSTSQTIKSFLELYSRTVALVPL